MIADNSIAATIDHQKKNSTVSRQKSTLPTSSNTGIMRHKSKARRTTPNSELRRAAGNDDWQAWIMENLLEGVSEQSLKRPLASAGFSVTAARKLISEVKCQPAAAAALKKASVWRKQQSLLELYRQLFRQSGAHTGIERRQCLSPESFYREYYYANRPVIVQGWMQNWPAMSLWSPEYLKNNYEGVEIEVTTNRSADPDYEFNVESHKAKTTVGEFVNRVIGGGRTNDYYLVAQNFAIEDTELRHLAADLGPLPGIIASDSTGRSNVSIWFGPAGTITPLHHDGTNVLFGQVYGRKRFLLIPAFELPYVYNNRWLFSKVDPDNPDYETFPLLRQADIMEVILNPGDTLLIPVGWWHWVEALDVSISVNFQNFLVPGGNTEWDQSGWYLDALY